MSNIISTYKIKLLIIRPEQANAIVTLKDQKALGIWFTHRRAKWVMVIIPSKKAERIEKMAQVRKARLSKKMIVTEITDAQWGNRYRLPETIAGTGIHATQKQLAESFIIG